MPSFDIVSKIDFSEVDNAINGAMREIQNRYDFKNSESKITRNENEFELIELRLTSGKKDLLQKAIQLTKELEIKQPLQYINFRD